MHLVKSLNFLQYCCLGNPDLFADDQDLLLKELDVGETFDE